VIKINKIVSFANEIKASSRREGLEDNYVASNSSLLCAHAF
jgi:hypothetical protein